MTTAVIIISTIILYHYLLFPLVVFVVAKIRKLRIDKSEIAPTVSLIIAAYNEEKIIDEKIQNSFHLDYPKDKLEIIVVSDGSNDSTPRIVEKYKKHGVKGLFSVPRKGKTAALNHAVRHANGKIIVFSDANSMYQNNAIKMLTRNFNDPSIGGVCGRKNIVKNMERESSRGDGLFWNIESTLKTLQSEGGSISNGDGEIFALRKNLYKEIPESIINDDQTITFNIVTEGYRVVYENEAVSYEEASIVLEDDFKVKARMVTGGYQTISLFKKILLPPKNYFALQFISHKVLRYLMPLFLIALFLSNLFVIEGVFFYLFFLQLLFYCTALIGLFLKRVKIKQGPFYIPLYYCLMNIAAIYGLVYYLRKASQVSVWKKAAR